MNMMIHNLPQLKEHQPGSKAPAGRSFFRHKETALPAWLQSFACEKECLSHRGHPGQRYQVEF